MNKSSTAVDSKHTQTVFPARAEIRRVILLCPDLHEAGGIGMVSRLGLRALQSYAATDCHGEIWSYGEPADDAGSDVAVWKTRYAHCRKATATLWGLKAALNDARHTLVVAMHLHLAPLAIPLIKRGAHLAVFLHGIEAWVPLCGLRRRGLQGSALMLANSAHTIRRFKAANPSFADRMIHLCPLGIPETAHSTGEPRVTGPFALIVGRLSSKERYKGHDTLLEIWCELIKLCPNARLMVVGDGDDRARLEMKTKKLQLANMIIFLGKATGEKLESLYRDCSFFVMPSSEEGFGLVFLEAMRAGKACIAGKGAAEEVINDNVTGIIVPSHDRKELLTAMSRLFRDPDLCAGMGRTGRERYLAHFTQADFERRFLTALDLLPPAEGH
jgi:phosphatidylinositol alpha-1,6-mannosyltransferase